MSQHPLRIAVNLILTEANQRVMLDGTLIQKHLNDHAGELEALVWWGEQPCLECGGLKVDWYSQGVCSACGGVGTELARITRAWWKEREP